MGLIREPKNINFTVLDKPWTSEERKALSVFIKLRKEQRNRKAKRSIPAKKGAEIAGQ